MYCTVLCCTVLYCTALYCAVLYCTVLHCTVLHCTVLYCTALYCTVLHCTVLYCTVLHCTLLHCTLLYSTVLYCTVHTCTSLSAAPNCVHENFRKRVNALLVHYHTDKRTLVVLVGLSRSKVHPGVTCTPCNLLRSNLHPRAIFSGVDRLPGHPTTEQVAPL